jgi:hypothetical protein
MQASRDPLYGRLHLIPILTSVARPKAGTPNSLKRSAAFFVTFVIFVIFVSGPKAPSLPF